VDWIIEKYKIMIKKEIIKGNVFLEQTTFYIYRNEQDQIEGNVPFLTTSSKEDFERNKELINAGKLVLLTKK